MAAGPDTSTQGPSRPPGSGRACARAYCGPAHGREWSVDTVRLLDQVELICNGTPVAYRLVRHRHTGRPGRDRLGNHLYMPADTAVALPDGPRGIGRAHLWRRS